MQMPDYPTMGGMIGDIPPRACLPLPPSLAYLSIGSGGRRFAGDGRHAPITLPVLWNGKIAKVTVVASPERHSSIIERQVGAARVSVANSHR